MAAKCEELTVELHSGGSYGFSVLGGRGATLPPVVCEIIEGSVAYHSVLESGDVILEANHVELADLSTYEITKYIGSIPGRSLVLRIRKDPEVKKKVAELTGDPQDRSKICQAVSSEDLEAIRSLTVQQKHTHIFTNVSSCKSSKRGRCRGGTGCSSADRLHHNNPHPASPNHHYHQANSICNHSNKNDFTFNGNSSYVSSIPVTNCQCHRSTEELATVHDSLCGNTSSAHNSTSSTSLTPLRPAKSLPSKIHSLTVSSPVHPLSAIHPPSSPLTSDSTSDENAQCTNSDPSRGCLGSALSGPSIVTGPTAPDLLVTADDESAEEEASDQLSFPASDQSVPSSSSNSPCHSPLIPSPHTGWSNETQPGPDYSVESTRECERSSRGARGGEISALSRTDFSTAFSSIATSVQRSPTRICHHPQQGVQVSPVSHRRALLLHQEDNMSALSSSAVTPAGTISLPTPSFGTLQLTDSIIAEEEEGDTFNESACHNFIPSTGAMHFNSPILRSPASRGFHAQVILPLGGACVNHNSPVSSPITSNNFTFISQVETTSPALSLAQKAKERKDSFESHKPGEGCGTPEEEEPHLIFTEGPKGEVLVLPSQTSPNSSIQAVVDMPSARRLARRLFNLEGFKRSDIARQLSKKNEFAQVVSEAYFSLYDFAGERIDEALRKFMKSFVFIGETQERERILSHFANRYFDCNPEEFPTREAVDYLVCALILLNQDLHGQHYGKRMTANQFISNVIQPGPQDEGYEEYSEFPRQLLKDLYYSIKNQPLLMACEDEDLDAESESAGVGVNPKSLTSALQSSSSPNGGLNEETPGEPFIPMLSSFVSRKWLAVPRLKRTSRVKRSWKSCYISLRGDHIAHFKLKKLKKQSTPNQFFEGSETFSRISILHALAQKPSNYTKKTAVFLLRTSDWSEYLYQCQSEGDVTEWIDSINLAAAFSAPPLPGALGSEPVRPTRTILPLKMTSLSLTEQIKHWEECINSSQVEQASLKSHLNSASGSTLSMLQDHFAYLTYEIQRYHIYIERLLETCNRSTATSNGQPYFQNTLRQGNMLGIAGFMPENSVDYGML